MKSPFFFFFLYLLYLDFHGAVCFFLFNLLLVDLVVLLWELSTKKWLLGQFFSFLLFNLTSSTANNNGKVVIHNFFCPYVEVVTTWSKVLGNYWEELILTFFFYNSVARIGKVFCKNFQYHNMIHYTIIFKQMKAIKLYQLKLYISFRFWPIFILQQIHDFFCISCPLYNGIKFFLLKRKGGKQAQI